ncbi:TPA: trypsin-like peptidase domain-containing protein [Enterobacter kobei]|nr:trypsin-like peptidase domain-containing protein [Enterobacter kobei]
MKITTSDSKSNKRIISSISEKREIIKLPINGNGGSQEKIIIETGSEGRFKLCLKNISIDNSTAIIIESANGRAFQVITKNKLNYEGEFFYTQPLSGGAFTIRSLSKDKKSKYSFVIESLIFSESPLVEFPDEFDSYGRINSPNLKEIDYNTYKWTRPVGETSNWASGWLLGKSNYFISCAHVLSSGFVNTVHFLGDNNSMNGVEISSNGKVIAMGAVPDPKNYNENNDDYAVIELDEFDMNYSRLSDLAGGIALNTEDESLLSGDSIFITGYPADTYGTQLTSYYSVEDVSSSLRASLRSTYEQQILVDAYASPGNSGGPIISVDKETVVGILWGEVRAVFVGQPTDPDYIYRGIKGSHAWNCIKDKISGNFISSTGLAADYDIFSGKIIFDIDSGWQTVTTFSDSTFYKEFSGEISHFDDYSLIKVKAKNKIDESLIDINLRLAQSTDEGIFNIGSMHGSQGSQRTLIICCNTEDNTDELQQGSLYHMWCGLEAFSTETNSPLNYVVYSLDITKS